MCPPMIRLMDIAFIRQQVCQTDDRGWNEHNKETFLQKESSVISLKNTLMQPHAGINPLYRNTGFLPQLTLCCLLIGFICFNSTTRSVPIHDHIWKSFVN